MESDELVCKPCDILHNMQVGIFFDPIGFLSLNVRYRSKAKVQWDEPISGPLLVESNVLINSLR